MRLPYGGTNEVLAGESVSIRGSARIAPKERPVRRHKVCRLR